MTERRRGARGWAAALRARFGVEADARLAGSLLCAGGLALTAAPRLVWSAVGLELIALAFWMWARAAADRALQVPRWQWLRRPAAALWLAAASEAVLVRLSASPLAADSVRMLRTIEAAALLWAGLELLAALPLERPFSDRPGPLLAVGPWLPLLLPAAGFVLLWTHAEDWRAVPLVRTAALALLLFTQALAVLRAFGRRHWVTSLRWLSVADSAVAVMLVATRVLPASLVLALWVAAFGGRAALLAGELHGASPRRRPHTHRLWRLSGWFTSSALAWPLIVAFMTGGAGEPARPWAALVSGLAATLGAWISVRRLVEAPERRSVVRRESAVSLGTVAAGLTLAASVCTLLAAWWEGFRASWPVPLLATLPALLGGGLALALRGERDAALAGSLGARARAGAHGIFGVVTTVERRLVGVAAWIGRVALVPLRDLHTGDAQEYLLFLVALSVLAAVLPLLR